VAVHVLALALAALAVRPES